MRKLISLILLVIIAGGIVLSLKEIPFGISKIKIGDYYIKKGIEETGATNIVTSVVVSYRGFDTLGEITILFTAAIGLSAVLGTYRKRKAGEKVEPPSFIVKTGCRFLFPILLLVGAYIFIHGHLTPGGGFQGGAIIASAFLLMYLGCEGKRINENTSIVVEVLGALTFIVLGIIGLTIGKDFLFNFLPKGEPNTLLSAGIIPVIYIAIGFKVGSELAGIIDHLIEKNQ
ncbi:MAG: Na(+)/H(+) antiporter subunit B [Bacteroidales bacterium]|nr:Na(+)/H(+) antiporter subunit B [Bacteroidales bacterium]